MLLETLLDGVIVGTYNGIDSYIVIEKNDIRYKLYPTHYEGYFGIIDDFKIVEEIP